MDIVAKERRAGRRNALQGLGAQPDLIRGFANQAAAYGWEAEILALPFVGGVVELQNPSTGAPLFMVGVSPVDGGDEYA
jgi:hypothetical protein